MKLSELLEKVGKLIDDPLDVNENFEIESIEYDSRKLKPGSIFVAVKGYESDGHDYIDTAVKAGASVVLLSKNRLSEFLKLKEMGIILLTSLDTRRSLSKMSAEFYGDPSSEMHITGVTGTNGKTSFTYLLEAVYKHNGIKCGVMGTVNYRWPGFERSAPNTTPDSREVQEMLKEMLDAGVTHVIMEVSSHALELSRVIDVQFDTAVFTNLTGEHLDFHGNMDSYFSAKKKLFDLLEESSKKNKHAVVNLDDEYSIKLINGISDKTIEVLGYGFHDNAQIHTESESVANLISGINYNVIVDKNKYGVKLSVAGRFQLYNSLASLGAALGAKLIIEDIITGLESLENVPGRLEVVDSTHGFCAVVDYAHTSDALLKLLQSIREMDHSRIITVFGCGGDRDKTKRPEMGHTAVEYSDIAIVSSDNPRTEDPDTIIKDILKGIDKDNYIVEVDRGRAIEQAVTMAQKNDIIVIAGKGHENYQIIGKEKIHFDDREVVAMHIAKRTSL